LLKNSVVQTLRATNAKEGDRKVGVVWHTQGSGKSLSMVFYVGQMITHPQMKNPTIVMVLGSFSIFSGAFQDKKRVKRAEILDIFASIPSAIMQEERKDEKTGLVFQLKIKKVAAYHQYYAVQKAVEQTLRATKLKNSVVSD
jgi:type I site-specific restriction-modification system R (restriction) subunit